MESFGKTLVVLGLVIAGVGVLVWQLGPLTWLGRLPGDIIIRRGNFTFYFPLATSILISLILTLIFTLFRR
jgi:predicted phosphohydrolase